MSERRNHGTGEGEPLPDGWLEAAADYNRPPDTPREHIWTAIEAELEARTEVGDATPIDRARARHRRRGGASRPPVGRWGLPVAAAAVLVLGIGIGRMTAPGVPGTPSDGPPGAGPGGEVAGVPAPGAEEGSGTAVRMVALEHLGRSESLLSLVKADARSGRVDPAVGRWARDLLTETRLLLDAADDGGDVTMQSLLEDLELILAQIALLERSTGDDPVRERTELDLIARGLDERNVMTRIQAVRPAGSGMLGT